MKKNKNVIVQATEPAAATAQKNCEVPIAIFLGARLRVTRRSVGTCLIFSLFFVLNACSVVWGEQKNWNALGDKSSWSDDANWYTAGTPTASDDALVDISGASVGISQPFHAKSITLGGKKTSTMTVESFTNGDVTPGAVSDEAFYNRKSGLLILKGSSGKMTLRGTYADSREEVSEEPSFMFYAQ